MKEEYRNLFYLISFLFITIFFILPYLVQISTYFHEKAHQDVFNKYGIENSYQFNFLNTIHNFYNPNEKFLGTIEFNLNQYNLLNESQKIEIHLAGILSDLRFLFLIGVFLSLSNLYIFYKIKFKKEYDLTWNIAINWILFMWLIALIQITLSNIVSSDGDIIQLIGYLRR